MHHDSKNNSELNESVSTIAMNLVTLKLLRIVSIPWEKQKAYECGIIDAEGNRIRNDVDGKKKKVPPECKKHYTLLHKVAFNLKRLLNKIPGIGKNVVTSYVGALLLLKEEYDVSHEELLVLKELFGHDDIEHQNHYRQNEENVIMSLFESSGPTVSTSAVGNLAIPPVIDRRRKISLFDVDEEQYRKIAKNPYRRKHQKWKNLVDPESFGNDDNEVKRCWRRGDLVFMRNRSSGEVCAISPIMEKENRPPFKEPNSREDTQMAKKSFTQIKNLLEDVKVIESRLLENELDVLYQKNKPHFDALDELHSFEFENTDDFESVLKEVARKYDTDVKELRKDYNMELEESLAAEILDSDGTIIQEVLDPSDEAGVWIRHFVYSENPKFKGKTKKERIKMALGAWYDARRKAGLEEAVSSDEMVDSTVNSILGSPNSSKFLDALEKKDRRTLLKIVKSEIGDARESSDIVDMILSDNDDAY